MPDSQGSSITNLNRISALQKQFGTKVWQSLLQSLFRCRLRRVCILRADSNIQTAILSLDIRRAIPMCRRPNSLTELRN
jgi:hypothetical protein